MKLKNACSQQEAFQLFLDGSATLAQVTSNGMKIDVPYLKNTSQIVTNKIKELEEEIREDEVFKVWRKIYGKEANLASKPQTAHVLFEVMKFPFKNKTSSGKRIQADIDTIESLNIPFAKKYTRLNRLKKVKSTYIGGILREVCDGFLHPNFHLDTVKTFRGSSSEINFQSIPVRDDESSGLLRKAFISRGSDYLLVETDFSGIEVSISACVVGSTKIETIDGPQTIKKVISRVRRGENVWVYGYDRNRKRIAISKVLEGGLTGKKARVFKVTLDNGESICATPDHKFLMRNGEYKNLRDLKSGDSLIPFYKTKKKSSWGTVYEKIYLNNGENIMSHNLIALDVYDIQIRGSDLVVHHRDHNGCNNSLDNLEVMNRTDHMKIHVKDSWREGKSSSRCIWMKTEEGREQSRRMNKERKEKWSEKDWKEFGQRVSEGIERKGGRKGENNSMYGKSQTEETKRKISLAKKGKKLQHTIWNKGLTKENNESVKKASQKMKGRMAWNKGRKLPPLSKERRQQISEQMSNRLIKPSTRKKHSLCMKKYWKNKELEVCSICGGEFTRVTNTHLQNKHNMTLEDYKKTKNHTVVSVEPFGREDVYNITVDGIHNYATSAGVVIKNCYHQDPTMIEYIKKDPGAMHTDMAQQCFLMSPEIMGPIGKGCPGKTTRYAAKNLFVFPQFYGSYYVDCAKGMWAAIDKLKLTTGDGIPLKEHLRKKGIKELGACDPSKSPVAGTFEHHIQKVQDHFWGKRFPVYAQWKKDWWEAYQKTSKFQMYTGFVVRGVYRRNEVINYAVQGTAFHCLLWSLIQLQNWLNRKKMKTRIIGQIHDSIVADVHVSELDAYLKKIKEITMVRLREHWKWINVPMIIEIETCPPSGNWYEKKSIPL